VKLLIDANLSPRVAAALRDAGFDAIHVVDQELLEASDDEIFDRALEDGRVVVTADSDFGALLALRRSASPSVIQLRQVAELGPDAHIAVLLANLQSIGEHLERGVIVSLGPTRLAVRDLPIR
jgi:predicted nuclease of predicted toxin-antitoxin system